MSKRFGLFPAPQKSSPRPSHRQGNLEDMASSSSGGQNDNTTVEEIYLPPPQPRTSTWQQNRTSIGSAATLDTTRRYTVDIPKTPRDQTLPEYNKRRPKKSNLNLLARSSTVLCKLGLSEAEIKTQLENDRAELVRDLVRMPRRTRAQAIRSLAVSFEEKRGIRHRVLEAKLSKDSVKRTCCTDCSEQVSLALRRFWASLLSWCVRMQLWNGALKEIGGRFGTAVLTYFAFLKWLLMFNVSLLLFNFSFITVPEIIQAHNTTADNSTFKGLELLTGTGYFDQSIFFYGGYNGEMIKVGSYDMQLAYLFTMFTYMMLCGISIVYRLGKSVWRSVFANSQIGYGAWRFFCSWDFSILNEKAIHSFQKKIFVQIKESLADSTEKPVPTASDRLKSLGLHATAWFLYIALALISCTSVYYLATYNLEMVKEALHSGDLKSEAFFLLLPLLVSFINLVVPLLYALLSRIEHYENLRIKMYAGLLRDVLLKMSILGILCYYWLTDAPSEIPCWESFVGQDVYRMVITDFLFSVLGCVFGEYLCSLIGTKCLKNLKPPEFDITRNVLDLIYAQTLVWIGVYFSPLLPIIQIVKLFILFYMKKLSISLILRPSTGPGLAAEMKMAFVALLFFPSYIGSLFIVGYIIWRLKPSATCGPFQGFEVTMDAVSSWLESTDISAHRLVIQGQLLLLLVSSIMLIILCFLWQIVQDRKHLIIALREQIVNEGKDKAFLLEKLRTTQGLSPRPQVRFLNEEARSGRRASYKPAQNTPGPRGPRKGRVGPGRPLLPPEMANQGSPASSPNAPGGPPSTGALVDSRYPQQQQQQAARAEQAARPDGRSSGAASIRGQSTHASSPAADTPRSPLADSPGAPRANRADCWVEDERPGPPPPVVPQIAWGNTPPRYPRRLEPLTPRGGAQAPMPGAAPNNRRHTDRTPRSNM